MASRSYYMQREGIAFSVACGISMLIACLVIVIFFFRWCCRKRRPQVNHEPDYYLDRAQKAFEAAGERLQKAESKQEQGCSYALDISKVGTALSSIGSMFERLKGALKDEIELNEIINDTVVEECSIPNDELVDIFRNNPEVTKLLTQARDALWSAGSDSGAEIDFDYGSDQIDGPNSMLKNIKNAIIGASVKARESTGDKKAGAAVAISNIGTVISHLLEERLSWGSSTLFSVYGLVFRQSVQSVITQPGAWSGPKSVTRREFLIGGYKIVPKYSPMIHVYFLTMLLIVANWFFLVLFDSAIYRKTTTCNDINLERDAYMCFDVSHPITAGPIDCLDPEIMGNDDVHVLCYLQSLSIPTAISVAFSFAQLIIFALHISFTITLSCVKKHRHGGWFALASHSFICLAYAVAFIAYGVIIASYESIEYSEEKNIFYGPKILHIIMAIWGFVTIFFVTVLSPYWWLLEKDSRAREYSPAFTHV